MRRFVTVVCVGLIALGGLISLFTPANLFAGIVVIAAIATLSCFAIADWILLLFMLRSVSPESWMHRRSNCPKDSDRRKDDTDWANDLVDGTAMDLIDWDD